MSQLDPAQLKIWQEQTMPALKSIYKVNKEGDILLDGEHRILISFNDATLRAIESYPPLVERLNQALLASGTGGLQNLFAFTDGGTSWYDHKNNRIVLGQDLFTNDDYLYTNPDNGVQQYHAVANLAHELSHALYDRNQYDDSSAIKFAESCDLDEAEARYSSFVIFNKLYEKYDSGVIEAYKNTLFHVLWEDNARGGSILRAQGDPKLNGPSAYEFLQGIIDFDSINEDPTSSDGFQDTDKAAKIAALAELNARIILYSPESDKSVSLSYNERNRLEWLEDQALLPDEEKRTYFAVDFMETLDPEGKYAKYGPYDRNPQGNKAAMDALLEWPQGLLALKILLHGYSLD